MFKRNNEETNNERMNGKKKKILLVGGTVVATSAAIALTGFILWKVSNKKDVNKEAEMLRDIVLEAGVFDAAISNISRKIDRKRCQLAQYLSGCNIDESKVQKFKDEIIKLEKMMYYAVNMKATMIEE